MSSKRQTTMAKMLREQTVRERRARKQLRKAERKADKLRSAAEPGVATEDTTTETLGESPGSPVATEAAVIEESAAPERQGDGAGSLEAAGERA